MKRWKIPKPDKALAKALSKELALNDFLVLLLTVRGFDTAEKIKDFLVDDDMGLKDPFSLKDMDKAVARIRQALDTFETIAVFGDYDVDGITATVLLYSYLEVSGANVMLYIPERKGEGYGISRAAIETLSERGVSLIITVDNGISALAEIDCANQLGIDVVVTDHHQPSEQLPKAYAVVDPHRTDCESQDKNLAGVGVVYKLVCALEEDMGDINPLLESFAELVAIGTVADVVPLTGENRRLVQRGLQHMVHTDRPGLRALIDEAGLDIRHITASDIAFGLAPRMNATGRMGSPLPSVKLLLSEDPEEARLLAAELGEENRRRQSIERVILKQIQEYFRMHPERLYDRVLVVDGEGFHQGVIGIVAARLVERYGKPAVVIAREGETAKGSGRSLPGFSLYEAFSACADLFQIFGGHELAAGMSMDASNLEVLRERLNAYAAQQEMPAPELQIDLKLNPAGLSTELVTHLSRLEPFGCENPSPLFALMGMTLTEILPVGGGRHLRLTVSREEYAVTVMYFGVRPEEFPFVKGDQLDLAVTLSASEYRGQEQLSVYARDIRFSGWDASHYIREQALYEAFRRGEPLSFEEAEQLLPTRADHAVLYRFLRKTEGWRYGLDVLCFRVSAYAIGYGRLLVALDMMEEKGLIHREQGGQSETIVLSSVSQKVDLQSGEHYERLVRAMK